MLRVVQMDFFFKFVTVAESTSFRGLSHIHVCVCLVFWRFIFNQVQGYTNQQWVAFYKKMMEKKSALECRLTIWCGPFDSNYFWVKQKTTWSIKYVES